MTRRILQIIPTLVRGGAEKQLTLLAAQLPRDRYETHVAVLTHSGPLENELKTSDIPVHAINKRWKVDPLAYWKLRRLIRSLKPDIVQTWLFAANSYGRYAAIRERVPVVIGSERCVDPWKIWHELAIDRYLAKRSKKLVANSSGVADFYEQQGIPREKFHIIPNGVAAFDPPQSSREDLLADLQLPGDSKLILAIGRLWPQKRMKDLIWAADLLKVIRPDTHLLIVGDGPQRSRLEQYTNQVAIADRVHLLGLRSDTTTLLQHADCLWLGSGYEGQSNAIMEAMSAGVPVFATDIPGNRDLIIDGESGILVPVGDRAAFASKTNVLLNDPEQATAISRAARKRMIDEFSVEQMVARYADFYDEI
ncbi:MAG: glycosyltransferase involved in cell wall biosynthesis [Pirellulaceae bacterium]|jgi:glycosyltransferase involved in cell wall biosynthesis